MALRLGHWLGRWENSLDPDASDQRGGIPFLLIPQNPPWPGNAVHISLVLLLLSKLRHSWETFGLTNCYF